MLRNVSHLKLGLPRIEWLLAQDGTHTHRSIPLCIQSGQLVVRPGYITAAHSVHKRRRIRLFSLSRSFPPFSHLTTLVHIGQTQDIYFAICLSIRNALRRTLLPYLFVHSTIIIYSLRKQISTAFVRIPIYL